MPALVKSPGSASIKNYYILNFSGSRPAHFRTGSGAPRAIFPDRDFPRHEPGIPLPGFSVQTAAPLFVKKGE